MSISSSVRHGDPIADIRQSPLPGSGQQAFATRQFQEFLDDLEFSGDQLDSSKLNQQLAVLQSKFESKFGVVRKQHEIDVNRINHLLQLDKLRTLIASLLSRFNAAESQIITTATAHTTNGNETVICTNATPITITLNSTPNDGEMLHIKRQNIGSVAISGNVDGGTGFPLLSRYDAPNLVFTVDAGEWSII